MTSREVDEPDSGYGGYSRPIALRLVDGLVVALFLAVVMLPVVPLGSTRDWAWSTVAVATGAIAVLVALGLGSHRGFEVSERERRPLLILIGCFAFLVLFALLQMWSMAPASGSAWLYAAALRILGKAHAAVPDLAIDVSRNTLLKCFTCGLVFLMARAICRERGNARLLLIVLAFSAVAVVAYGLVMHVTTHSCYVGTYLKKQGEYNPYGSCLMSGTFVNSNSFGCYVGMGLIAAIALIFDARPRTPTAFDGRDYETLSSLFTVSRALYLAISLFLLGGLLFSASRAGFAATVVAGLVLAFLLMRNQLQRRPEVIRWVWIGMAVVLVISVVAGGALITKSMHADNSYSRVIIWLTSLRAIALSPWLGWGLGSFVDIYTILQPAAITQPNDLAHSTPLETIVEVGVIAAIPVFAIVLLPWGMSLRGGFKRRYRHRVMPAAAFAVAAVPILHSTIDFSLQIPAIGILTSAFLGMGWAQAFKRRPMSRHDHPA